MTQCNFALDSNSTSANFFDLQFLLITTYTQYNNAWLGEHYSRGLDAVFNGTASMSQVNGEIERLECGVKERTASPMGKLFTFTRLAGKLTHAIGLPGSGHWLPASNAASQSFILNHR